MTTQKQMARRAIAALDLTNLNDDCTAEDIDALCARANTPYGPVAAVCVWPRFVAQATQTLKGTPIRVATVVNFPTGMEDAADVRAMVKQAVKDGADEIDMVIPYPELLEGRATSIAPSVARVVEAADIAMVKAILETGILNDEALIRTASEQAIAGGAHFIKTSTGKTPANASLMAAQTMLEVIRDSGKDVGLKPSGGVKTTEDAAAYLALADDIMGEGWADDRHFRIGASGVLTALIATLEDAAAPQTAGGY